MLRYINLYKSYLSHVRIKYGKKDLSEKVVTQRMKKVINDMSIEDRYYLELLSVYKTMYRVSMMAELPIKKTTNKVNIALNHFINPNNVVYITGIKLFNHTGKKLTETNMFSTRTLNALSRQSIVTNDDLCTWLQIGLVYLYNIPGVGKWGQLEILRYLESVKKIKLK